MARFNKGDRVVANRTIVAVVDHYDEQSGRLTLIQELPGGSTNRIEGPIVSYDLELLVRDAETEPVALSKSEQARIEALSTGAEGPQDEITTAGTL